MASISVISAGQFVDGAVSAQEDLLVEGRIGGSIGSTHKVIVAADGYLEASVQAREVVVEGTIVGDLTVSEDVTVTATGQVQGEIRAKRLSLEAGGRICGLVVTGVEPVTAAPRPRGQSGRARTKTAAWSPSELSTAQTTGADEVDEVVETPQISASSKAKTSRKTSIRKSSSQARARGGRKRGGSKEVVEVDEVVETSGD